MKQGSMYRQEIELFFLLPGIRRELAIRLKKEGRTQKQISQFFGVSEPAISQYLRSKRGAEIDFPNYFLKEIDKSSKVVMDKSSFVRECQRLLRIAKDQKLVCSVHNDVNKDLPKDCDLCYD